MEKLRNAVKSEGYKAENTLVRALQTIQEAAGVMLHKWLNLEECAEITDEDENGEDDAGVCSKHLGGQKQTGIASCWMSWRMVQLHFGR